MQEILMNLQRGLLANAVWRDENLPFERVPRHSIQNCYHFVINGFFLLFLFLIFFINCSRSIVFLYFDIRLYIILDIPILNSSL